MVFCVFVFNKSPFPSLPAPGSRPSTSVSLNVTSPGTSRKWIDLGSVVPLLLRAQPLWAWLLGPGQCVPSPHSGPQAFPASCTTKAQRPSESPTSRSWFVLSTSCLQIPP